MMEELFKISKEEGLSSIFDADNVIETPISPDVGKELHQSSSTIIQVSKLKFDQQTSYILPLPQFSKRRSQQLHKEHIKNSNSNVQLPKVSVECSNIASLSSEMQGSTQMTAFKPRVVPNETQETDERKVFCGNLNSLIDNWMENMGVITTMQDVTLPKQPVEMPESTQEVMSLGSQPVILEKTKQEVMSLGNQPVILERTKQEVMSTEKYKEKERKSSEDANLVCFVDAILTAADHGRLKEAKLMNNSNRKN